MADFYKWEHQNLVKLVQDLIVENTALRYDAERPQELTVYLLAP